MVLPGSMRPSRSAASIMATPIRSLTLPPGLNASTLANNSTWAIGATRVSFTIGVRPTRSMMLVWTSPMVGDTLDKPLRSPRGQDGAVLGLGEGELEQEPRPGLHL